MIKVVVPLLIFVLVVRCSTDEGILTKKLLENLKLKGNGIAPIIDEAAQNIPIVVSSFEDCRATATLSGIPDNLISRAFEYQDDEDFFYISKKFSAAAKRSVFQRLADVSKPYFTFPELWLNHLMASELTRFFDGISSASSLHDRYELACIKFIKTGQSSYCSQNLGVCYRLRRYLHEFLYGSDSYVPATEKQWSDQLLTKMSHYKLDHSIEYYRREHETICDRFFDNQEDRDSVKKYLDSFLKLYKGPLTPERFIRFQYETSDLGVTDIIHNASFYENVRTLNEFYFHEILIPNSQVVETFKKFAKDQLFSESLFQRIPLDENPLALKEIIRELGGFGKNRQFDSYLAKNDLIAQTNESNAPIAVLSYILSRNVQDSYVFTDYFRACPFTGIILDHSSHNHVFDLLLNSSDPSLTQIDIFFQLVRANFYEFHRFRTDESSIVHKAYSNDSPIFFNILTKESPVRPIKFFHRGAQGIITTIFSQSVRFNLIKLTSFVNSLDRDDPLPLIFINPKDLKELRGVIVDRFNLNKRRYYIDFEPRMLQLMHEEFYRLESLRDKTVTFKQLLDTFGIEDYHTIFTSKNDPDLFKTGRKEPIVSLNQYIFYL